MTRDDGTNTGTGDPQAGGATSASPPPAPVPPMPPAPPVGVTRAPQEGVPQIGATVALSPGAPEPDRPESRGIAGPLAGTMPEHRDGRSRLTRPGMLQALREGGSVIHNNRIITREADLPSETELAEGDPQAIERARANLRERRAALDADEARLESMTRGDAADVVTDSARTNRNPRGRAPEGGASGTQGGNVQTAEQAEGGAASGARTAGGGGGAQANRTGGGNAGGGAART
jgi:hypothetical protein